MSIEHQPQPERHLLHERVVEARTALGMVLSPLGRWAAVGLVAWTMAGEVGRPPLASAASPAVITALAPERTLISNAPLPSSAVNVETNPSTLRRITDELRESGSRYGVDALGYRISDAWVAADRFEYQAYQGGMLQRNPTNGQVFLWNTLDQMHLLNLDPLLDNGSLGVLVPPHEDVNDNSQGNLELAFKNRAAHFGIPPAVQDFVNTFRISFETGVYTSKGKNYGPFTIYRLQRMAVQVWTDGPNKGLIQRILVGDAAKAAGLVPLEVLLPAPEVPGVGGGSEVSLAVEPWVKYGAPTLAERPLMPRASLKDKPRLDTSELRGGIFGSERFISRLQSEVLPEYRRRDVVGYSEFIREVEYIIETFDTRLPATADPDYRTIFLHYAAASPPFTEEGFPGENMLRPILSIAHEQRHIVDTQINKLPDSKDFQKTREINAVRAAIETAQRMNWAENYVVKALVNGLWDMENDPNFIPWWST